MRKIPRIAVIGPVGSGKSTFSEILAKAFRDSGHGIFLPESISQPVSWAETSSIIYETVAFEQGLTVEELRTTPKEKLRPHLIITGDKLCERHGADFLSQTLFNRGHLIVAGMRKPEELHAIRKLWPDLLTVWIHRPYHVGPKDNTLLTIGDAAWVITNTSMRSMKRQAEFLITELLE